MFNKRKEFPSVCNGEEPIITGQDVNIMPLFGSGEDD